MRSTGSSASTSEWDFNSKAFSPTQELKRNWLISYRDAINRQRNHYQNIELRWSWSRVILFFSGLAVWLTLNQHHVIALAASTPLLGLFVFVISRHHRIQSKLKSSERLLLVIEESLHFSCDEGTPVRTWKKPANTDVSASLVPVLKNGTTWALTNQECDDLDLYAPPVGIFGLLNRSSTELGARRLRDMIENPCLSAEHILSRQESIRWLDDHPVERLNLLATISSLRNQDQGLDRFIESLHKTTPLFTSKRFNVTFLWSLSCGCFFLFVAARVYEGEFYWVSPIMFVLILNAISMRSVKNKINTILSLWKNLGPTIERFLFVTRKAATDLPEETELQRLRRCFMKAVNPEVLPSLRRALGWTEIGGMIHELLNILLLYDLHVAKAIHVRVIPHGNILQESISALGDLEALCSLACYAGEQSVACYPTIATKPEIAITAGRHPLVLLDQVVPNNVHLTTDSNIWVITGSNATGKSTLLRMVGINVLMAQLGTVATAQKMTWSPLRLMTDLTVGDNLSKGESYFLAEVRHLYRMVLPENNEALILGLIDEPFRGTNSQEKLAASLALIEYLVSANNLFLVTTHDEALTRLASTFSTVENYHFQEELESDRITFDYLLRPGPTKTRIGLKILAEEGYPPDMLARARKWIHEISTGT